MSPEEFLSRAERFGFGSASYVPTVVPVPNPTDGWTMSDMYALRMAKAAVNRFDMDGYTEHMTPALQSKLELLGDPTKVTVVQKVDTPVKQTTLVKRYGYHPKDAYTKHMTPTLKSRLELQGDPTEVTVAQKADTPVKQNTQLMPEMSPEGSASNAPRVVPVPSPTDGWTMSELCALRMAKAAVNRFDMDGYTKHMTPALQSKLELLGDPTKVTVVQKADTPVRQTTQLKKYGFHPKSK